MTRRDPMRQRNAARALANIPQEHRAAVARAAIADVRRMLCTAPDGATWGAKRTTAENVRSGKNRCPETLVTLAAHNGALRRVALRLLALDAELRGVMLADEATLYRETAALFGTVQTIEARCQTGVASTSERAELTDDLLQVAEITEAYAETEATIVHAPLRMVA